MATKKIRILVDLQIDGKPYHVNDVVEIESSTADSLEKAGLADCNKSAVKYALDLASGKFIQHNPPQQAEPEPVLQQNAQQVDPEPVPQ